MVQRMAPHKALAQAPPWGQEQALQHANCQHSFGFGDSFPCSLCSSAATEGAFNQAFLGLVCMM